MASLSKQLPSATKELVFDQIRHLQWKLRCCRSCNWCSHSLCYSSSAHFVIQLKVCRILSSIQLSSCNQLCIIYLQHQNDTSFCNYSLKRCCSNSKDSRLAILFLQSLQNKYFIGIILFSHFFAAFPSIVEYQSKVQILPCTGLSTSGLRI